MGVDGVLDPSRVVPHQDIRVDLNFICAEDVAFEEPSEPSLLCPSIPEKTRAHGDGTSPAENAVDELAETITVVKSGIFLDDGEF